MRCAMALATALALSACSSGHGMDAHAETACSIVRNLDAGADSGNYLATIRDQQRAQVAARASSVRALIRAANMNTVASDLPTDSPLYKNLAESRYAAGAAWCRQHA